MSGVVVDTSVWVAHFRRTSRPLVALLTLDLVLVHPLIVGELACGTPPHRSQTLSDLFSLRPARQASLGETLNFIEREKLFGLGCGVVDLLLLCSTLITPGASLWTLDKRLGALAGRFGVLHRPHHR